jgi:hypothetical protein
MIAKDQLLLLRAKNLLKSANGVSVRFCVSTPQRHRVSNPPTGAKRMMPSASFTYGETDGSFHFHLPDYQHERSAFLRR